MTHHDERRMTGERREADVARFRFDPSISWGDVGMALALLLSGLIAFFSVTERVTVAETNIGRNVKALEYVAEDLRTYKVESLQAQSAMRGEIREELKSINDKLDRMIERGNPR